MYATQIAALAESHQHSLPPALLADLAKLLESAKKGKPWLPPTVPVHGTTMDLDDTEPGQMHADSDLDAITEGTLLHTAERRVCYDHLDSIGAGGMGEVWRIRDRDLKRVMAMKVILPHLAREPAVLARFIEEAQATAQLQHPGIVPVHEMGRLDDGRYYFTMKEVRGRTLGRLIREVHAVSPDSWQPTPSGWTFRKMIAAFHKVCSAVAYAHSKGVVHRDLKPSNIMIGEFGEVSVLDWGLAKVLGSAVTDDAAELDKVITDRSGDDTHATRMGIVAGTPSYMAPEQAMGRLNAMDARSDIYSLGCILYELLSGRPPYQGENDVLQQVLRGPPEALGRTGHGSDASTFRFGPASLERPDPGPIVPMELEEVRRRAMARAAENRHVSAQALADDIESWLDGSKRRTQALEVVKRAERTVPEVQRRRTQAKELQHRALAMLKDVPTWAPEAEKAAGWARQDEASELERAADVLALEREQLLHGALTHAPELPEAHAALVDDYTKRHQESETRREPGETAKAELLLRLHAQALPESHVARGRCATYLKGTGALTLVTEPPGAEVELCSYKLQNRRLVPEAMRSLGRTPLQRVDLPMGSYLCKLRHPADGTVVNYPVHVGRSEHVDGIRPGDTEPYPIRLPLTGELGPQDCLIPAGWFWSGGDPEARNGLPRRRLWCDGLVMRRYPVTNREYLVFLNALVAQGREEEALRFSPRERGGQDGQEGALIYGRTAAGEFELVLDADGDEWLPDFPVVMVDWNCAVAFAAWTAESSAVAWRLPGELEWEKAARGVDGRVFPWGDHLDPSWCCMGASHKGKRLPSVVDSYPVDESPYGVRGLGGNSTDWTWDLFLSTGPDLVGQTVQPVSTRGTDEGFRMQRGGSWLYSSLSVNSANRIGNARSSRRSDCGLRLARSYSQ